MKPTVAKMPIGQARKHELTLTVMFDATEADGSMVVRATNAKDTIECSVIIDADSPMEQVERLVGAIVLEVANSVAEDK